MENDKIREAVGLFEDIDQLQDAVRELENTAFPRQDISILGDPAYIREHFGTIHVHPEIAEDDPDAPRNSPVRQEEQTIATGALIGTAAYTGAVAAALASGGVTVPATIAAVAAGGGGGALLGGVLAKILGDQYDKSIEDQIGKGGLLLWVRTPDEDKEKIACDILRAHEAKHVRIHELAA